MNFNPASHKRFPMNTFTRKEESFPKHHLETAENQSKQQEYSTNTTLIFDSDQRAADILLSSHATRLKENVADEKNTLLLNTEDEVQNTTLNEYVTMLSGNCSKESINCSVSKKASERKIKHIFPHSPMKSSRDGLRTSSEVQRGSRNSTKTSRIFQSPIHRDRTIGSAKLDSEQSRNSISEDNRKLQVRDRVRISSPNEIRNIQGVVHRKSDSFGTSIKRLPMSLNTSPPSKQGRDERDQLLKNSRAGLTQSTKNGESTMNFNSSNQTNTTSSTKGATTHIHNPSSEIKARLSGDVVKTTTAATVAASKTSKVSAFTNDNRRGSGNSSNNDSGKTVTVHKLNLNNSPPLSGRVSKGSKALSSRKDSLLHTEVSPSRNVKALISPRIHRNDPVANHLANKLNKKSQAKSALSSSSVTSSKAVPTLTHSLITSNRASNPNLKKTTASTHITLVSEKSVSSNKKKNVSRTNVDMDSVVTEMDDVYSKLREKFVAMKTEIDDNDKLKTVIINLKDFMNRTYTYFADYEK